MKDKLEAIRQKCIEANSEIVELKFGCEVRVLMRGSTLKPESGYVVARYPNKQVEVFGTNWLPNEDEIIETIGRPIRLADVLLAINKFDKLPDYQSVVATAYGSLNLMSWGGGYEPASIVREAPWNLRQDDLEKQSPETIDSIANVLGV